MKKLLLPAAFFLSLTGFAQTTPTTISFTKGQKLELVTELKKTTSLELMGQAMETTMTSTMTELYDVENADAKIATLEHKVKRLVVNASGGTMGDQKFDSENESDRKGEWGKMLEKGVKNKYKMTVDASGIITSVTADDDNPNKKKGGEEDAMAAMVSQQMGVTVGLPLQGSLLPMKVLPNRELKAGEEWVDSSNKDGIRTITSYKVAGISTSDVVLNYTQNVEINSTQQLMGQEATIKSSDNATGQITVDKASGLLKQKTATVDSKGSISAQGMEFPVNSKTTMTVTVKPAL